MNIGKRLKEERERLGLTQSALGDIGDVGKTTVIAWERGTAFPNALFLADIAAIGADVRYIVTGQRSGDGIGESAVHQAVLAAVDLLSLEKKVDAGQLARAVVKLCEKGTAVAEPGIQQNISGTPNIGQNIVGGKHTITTGDIINNKGKRK